MMKGETNMSAHGRIERSERGAKHLDRLTDGTHRNIYVLNAIINANDTMNEREIFRGDDSFSDEWSSAFWISLESALAQKETPEPVRAWFRKFGIEG
jgi:hypothetical protein